MSNVTIPGTKTISLGFSGGVNEIKAANRLNANECLVMNNFRLTKDGTRIMKRYGCTTEVSNFAEDVYGYTTYYDSTPSFCELAVLESQIKRKVGAGSWTSIHTFSSTIAHPVKILSMQGKQFIINETDSRMIHTDGGDYQIGITAPTTLPTLTPATGGNLTPGIYRYAVGYARGGNFGCESNPIKSLIGSTTKVGTGTTTLAASGTYTGSRSRNIRVQVSSASTPDQIQYSFDGDNHLYIADTDNSRIHKRAAGDLSYYSKVGSQGDGNDEFLFCTGIAAYGEYLYIADYENDRVVKRRSDDLSFVAEIGTYGTDADEFNSPYGICCDGAYVYVTDRMNHRIVKLLASTLEWVATVGTTGTGDNNFSEPQGICVYGDYLYICDKGNDRIKRHAKLDLSYSAQTGATGAGNGQFNKPYGIFATASYIWVTDRDNHRVQRFVLGTLAYDSKFGTSGSGDTNFSYPRGITGDFDGAFLWICDTLNHRIKKYTQAGVYVSQIGSSGTGNDQFSSPSEISYKAIEWASTGIPVTTTVYMPFGIVLTFNATTGGVLNDYWNFTASASAVSVPNNGKVTLTSIPVSTDAQVSQRILYRTVVGGAVFYYLTTINDNTTTSFVDNIPDAGLGETMEEDRDILPNGKFAVWWDNRLWVSGTNIVYYSEVDTPEEFDVGTRYVTIRAGDIDDEITGMIDFKDSLYVFKRTSIFVILRRSDGSYGRFHLDHSKGCVAPWSLIEVEGRLMWLSQKGIEVYNGVSFEELQFSLPVERTIRALDTTKYDYITSALNREYNEVWVSIPDSSITIVYNYFANAWHTFEFAKPPSCLSECRNSSKKMVLKAGTRDGYVSLCDSGYQDGSTAITAKVRSGWHGIKDYCDVNLIELEYELPATFSLTCNLYVNFDKDVGRTKACTGSTPNATDIEMRRVIYDFAETGLRGRYVSVEYTNAEAIQVSGTVADLKINMTDIYVKTRTEARKIVGD